MARWRKPGRFVAVSAIALAGLTGACTESTTDPPPPGFAPRSPSLLATNAQRDMALDRLAREPYATMLAEIEATAARAYEEPDPMVWDHDTIGHNNTTAQANALLAWLKGDAVAAEKAKDFLLRMPTDFLTNNTWDVNIRMPHVLMTACYAWDMLRGTEWLTEDESATIEAGITKVTSEFFDRYLDNPIQRQFALGVSQNNHPIRTASAIGMVALAFPDHPDAPAWGNWAVSELSYLLGPDGRYLQADGGVSEGTFYFAFAFGPAIAFAIAMRNTGAEDQEWLRDCRNRQEEDPWLVTDCVNGEVFHYENPLDDPRFHASVDWSLALRMPSGWRVPIGDGNYIGLNGGALLTSFGGPPHFRWDFDHPPADSPEVHWSWTRSMDLVAHHIFYLDEAVVGAEPTWKNRFLADAGNAVFRSGWDEDARWLLLMGEKGPARKTLHDHVDGTSINLAAYGEYLLVDTGYYKPDDLDNALTADADAHNVILIDGQGAPDKGLLLDFGDTDASLENMVDGEALAYGEAQQSYEQTDITRGVTFVRQRYYVVADRLATSVMVPRAHAFRLHGYAGYDTGGVFELFSCQPGEPCGAKWERERAGVEVHLGSTAPGLGMVEPPYTPLMPPHVGAFNRDRDVEDHGVADGVVEAVAPGFLAVLAPYAVGGSGDDQPLTVEAVDAGPDASAFVVTGADGSEVCWLRGPSAASTLSLPDGKVVESDGAFSLVSLDGSFALLARGQSLSLDGTTLAQGSGEPVVVVE
ncbi:MAG: heparinase II/III family protein [Myxococcales bacterium]|nr:heparinase II/III family protein [Myxococcales bacterium]